jgi:hypothetical protein
MLGCKCSVQDIMVEGGIPIIAIGHVFFGLMATGVTGSWYRSKLNVHENPYRY